MYQFSRIFKMDFKNILINPMLLAGTIGLPLLLSLIMGFITAGSYGGSVTSYDYYCVTMLVFGALNNATLAANSFMEARIKKANMRLCTAPVPSFYIYFSKLAASFIYGTLCHTVTGLALYLLAGANFGGGYAVYLWLLLLGVEIFACSLSIMLCCIFKNEETVNTVISTLVAIIVLLGGGFFSIKGYGAALNAISYISPAMWIYTAAFEVIYDHSLVLLGLVCAGLMAVSAACIGICAKCFNREDYL